MTAVASTRIEVATLFGKIWEWLGIGAVLAELRIKSYRLDREPQARA